MIRFEQAEERHAGMIARCMRPRDVEEVRAGWEKAPYQAIRYALMHSFMARVCFFGLEPLAIYGLSSMAVLGGAAQVWIFGTRYIDDHPRSFARASRRELQILHKRAPLITNLIDMGDAGARKWLEWLGGVYVLPNQHRGGKVFAQFILEDRCRQG